LYILAQRKDIKDIWESAIPKMHRRRRIRRELMPQAMEIDGGEVDHSKPVLPSKRDHGSTDIEMLSDQLQKISVSQMAKQQQKKKKK
jgi:hypothetical protein